MVMWPTHTVVIGSSLLDRQGDISSGLPRSLIFVKLINRPSVGGIR